MYNKGYSKYRKTTYTPRSSYTKKKTYGPSRTKQLVTGDRQPTMVEQIANGAGQVAKLASAVMPIIAAVNTESKYYDQSANVSANTPGTNDNLIALTTAITNGTSDTTRIGNSILGRDLQVRLAMNFTSTIGAPNVIGAHCRMLLICWKDNASQNTPTIAKIFEQPNNLYSPVNKDLSDSFVVMKDKFFALNNSSGVAGSAGFTTMKIYKKLNWHLRYADSTTNSPTQNHIYLILRCGNTSGNSLTTSYYSRLNFTDN